MTTEKIGEFAYELFGVESIQTLKECVLLMNVVLSESGISEKDYLITMRRIAILEDIITEAENILKRRGSK